MTTPLPALEAAIKNKAVLVVYSLSRFSRRTVDCLNLAEDLVKHGASLVSLSERVDLTTASGLMVFRLLSVMAEAERDHLRSKRVFLN